MIATIIKTIIRIIICDGLNISNLLLPSPSLLDMTGFPRLGQRHVDDGAALFDVAHVLLFDSQQAPAAAARYLDHRHQRVRRRHGGPRLAAAARPPGGQADGGPPDEPGESHREIQHNRRVVDARPAGQHQRLAQQSVGSRARRHAQEAPVPVRVPPGWSAQRSSQGLARRAPLKPPTRGLHPKQPARRRARGGRRRRGSGPEAVHGRHDGGGERCEEEGAGGGVPVARRVAQRHRHDGGGVFPRVHLGGRGNVRLGPEERRPGGWAAQLTICTRGSASSRMRRRHCRMRSQ